MGGSCWVAVKVGGSAVPFTVDSMGTVAVAVEKEVAIWLGKVTPTVAPVAPPMAVD